MRIAVLNKSYRVTNVLALAPGVRPEDLKRVAMWRPLPDHPITPGWRYDPKSGRFLPPRAAVSAA